MPRYCVRSPAPSTLAAFDSRVRSATGVSCCCGKRSEKPRLAAAEIPLRTDKRHDDNRRHRQRDFALGIASEIYRAKRRVEAPMRPRKNEGAALSCANGRLGIKSADTSVSILASGNWLGVAHVPLAFILTALRNPPAQAPVLVTVRDSRLHIGNSSITCQWTSSECAGARTRRRVLLHVHTVFPD